MSLEISAVQIEPPAAPPGRHKRWLAKSPRGQFWLYFVAATFFGFGLSVYYFLFNIYLLGFGMNERSLGLIGSLVAVGSICGTIPAGILAGRIGLRGTLTGELLLSLVFLVLRACIIWLPAQLVLPGLAGMTICTLGVCLSPLIAGLTTEEQRPIAFSLMFAWGVCTNGSGGFVASRLPGLLRALPASNLVQFQCRQRVHPPYWLRRGCAWPSSPLTPTSHPTPGFSKHPVFTLTQPICGPFSRRNGSLEPRYGPLAARPLPTSTSCIILAYRSNAWEFDLQLFASSVLSSGCSVRPCSSAAPD